MALTQTQLAGEIAERSGITKSDAKRALEALEDVVLEQLADAEKVRIGGVVQLNVRVKEATGPRKGRNPATGEEIKIPAKKVVKFRVAKAVKDAIVPRKARNLPGDDPTRPKG